MKEIERLLQEYKIRFRDTEKIKEEGYPFGKPLTQKNINPEIGVKRMYNGYGKVFGYDDNGMLVWATADLTEAPDKWVVEKDESHPMWERFKEWWLDSENKYEAELEIGASYFFASDYENSECLLDFEGFQYLTLDQWAELFFAEGGFQHFE